ncbi:galactose oxidase [Mycena leptocephala]|nr:galactose oxidase [Mycena leptocephala]
MRLTSEMILQSRDTIGDVPPELIGASTALAGSKLYLFGGSLASAPDPKPLSELYALDLELWKWEAIIPATGDPVPTARYFHTVDIWKNHLVICGGLGAQGSSEQLQVLNDVQLYNLSTRRWLRSPRVPAVSRLGPVPRARHAHLSCVSSNQLFIIGGKDFFGEILDDVCVYDLAKKEWIHRQYSPIPRLEMTHSFAANSQWHVRTPPPDPPPSGKPDNLVRPTPLSYSDRATNKSPCDIYLYNRHDFGKDPHSAGNSLPENTEHGFLIWTLDLETNRWTRIETGELLNNGSWAKGYLWHEQSKFFVSGNTGEASSMLRPTCSGWDMVAVVDLEAALGIYQPPGLAALAEGKRTDFDFLCEDGRRIPCSRKIIVERWSWFRDQHARLRGADDSAKHQKRAEITIMQTGATLAQSYPVTMALLQYFYSLALGTPLQRAPAVLSYLMLISTEFEIPHLRALVRHAMHVALNETTAEGVYEIAASCGCRSLQIR